MRAVSHGFTHHKSGTASLSSSAPSLPVVLPLPRFILTVRWVQRADAGARVAESLYAAEHTRRALDANKTDTSLRCSPHALAMWRILRVLSRTRVELAGEF